MKSKLRVLDNEVYFGRYTSGYSYKGYMNSSMQRHGHGKLVDEKNQLIYLGGWQKDVRHGEGKECKLPLIISGYWENDQLHSGLVRNVDTGDLYDGNIQSNTLLPHGHGVLSCRMGNYTLVVGIKDA